MHIDKTALTRFRFRGGRLEFTSDTIAEALSHSFDGIHNDSVPLSTPPYTRFPFLFCRSPCLFDCFVPHGSSRFFARFMLWRGPRLRTFLRLLCLRTLGSRFRCRGVLLRSLACLIF